MIATGKICENKPNPPAAGRDGVWTFPVCKDAKLYRLGCFGSLSRSPSRNFLHGLPFVMLTLALTAGVAQASQLQSPDFRGQGFGVGTGVGNGVGVPEKEQKTQEDELYERGTKALDEHQWDKAVEAFDQAAKIGGRRPDGALYWKAYALNKSGRRPEAIVAVRSLREKFPRSRWVDDGKALEVEIRQASGQTVTPEAESDEDLKLMALNGLVGSDPERAVPLLEKFLQGNQSPKLKKRALFVLSQSASPRAREVVSQIARGTKSPDLQMEAIHSLGLFGGHESRQALADIYAASNDVNVKKTILRSFMLAGERDRLLVAAKSENTAELRLEAVRQLGLLGAHTELWELYQKESSLEVKKQVLQAMFLGGNAEKLIELARNEKDLGLRHAAVRNLGLMGKEKTGEALVSIYSTDKDLSIRRDALNALFLQGNAKALVDLARKETDPALRREIVGKLSLMRSKEATEYLMEILNK
jgi:HEAT repeat protein